MAKDSDVEQTAPDDSGSKTEGDTQEPPLATTDVNALRSSLRESASRLQFPETGEWTTEDLENIETAEDLSPDQWSKIFRINKVLYGFNIREPENDVVKARQQAFVLQLPPSTEGSIVNGIPEFEVDDSSSISIKQIKTDLQRSLAENGFSAKSIGAALSRVRDCFLMRTILRYHLNAGELWRRFNEIPRISVYEVSARGHIFVTACQLGGQLQSTKFAGSLTELNDIQKQDALKSEMGINFSAQYASGSFNYGKQRQAGEHRQSGRELDISRLAWTARGGNSLLCANPPGWARSVANPKHWRVIEQEKVVALHELVGRFEEWNGIPKLFEDIAQQRIKAGKQKTPTWGGKIRLRLGKKRLLWRNLDHSLDVTDTLPDEAPKEPVFTVVGANLDDRRAYPSLSSLPTDYPIFLLAGDEVRRSPKQGNQIQGIWVNERGNLKPEMFENKFKQITRFSFRLAGSSTGWRKYNQQPFETIKSGDKVNLYCHSLGIGPYADIERPPSFARPLMYSEIHGLCIQAPVQTSPYNESMRQILRNYDEGTLPRNDVEVFEGKGYITADDRIGKIKFDGLLASKELATWDTASPEIRLVLTPELNSGVARSYKGDLSVPKEIVRTHYEYPVADFSIIFE